MATPNGMPSEETARRPHGLRNGVVTGLGRLYGDGVAMLRFGAISGGARMMDDTLFRGRYRIPSARYVGWDYRWAGVYYVTICTRGRMICLGDVIEGQVVLSPLGRLVAEEWLKIPRHHPRVVLDEWIIMPDHMHGILIFQGTPREDGLSLGIVIGRFKAAVTNGSGGN